MLKKFLMAVIFTTALTFCVTSEKVFANDIWVAESEGYDIYIITDTIVHKTGDDWEGLWVVTKKIRDSQLESTTKWNFIAMSTTSITMHGCVTITRIIDISPGVE